MAEKKGDHQHSPHLENEDANDNHDNEEEEEQSDADANDLSRLHINQMFRCPQKKDQNVNIDIQLLRPKNAMRMLSVPNKNLQGSSSAKVTNCQREVCLCPPSLELFLLSILLLFHDHHLIFCNAEVLSAIMVFSSWDS